MEERREMNGQRMMTREELEMRLPALNHIAEQRDAKFRLRYAEKTVNNGIERGYTLDAGTRVSVNVYQNESWAQMSDEELFDTLNDLDGRYCVTEDQETIGERLNALFKSGELFEKIYPVVVSENNTENFTEAGITFDRYLDMLITYRIELMQMNDGIGTIRLQDNHLETFGISRQKIREAAFANLEGIVDFMTLRDDASGFKMVTVARKDKQFGGPRRCCSRRFARDLPRCSGPTASSSFHRAFQRSLLYRRQPVNRKCFSQWSMKSMRRKSRRRNASRTVSIRCASQTARTAFQVSALDKGAEPLRGIRVASDSRCSNV